ncbi:MAG: hypothetical protein K6G75_00525 [Lachnospiraceae bacterium]|nr:hypothetical protein [Lachnospiraceae bacterium]
MEDIITELQDMRYLNWTKTRKSSGTAGSFLKSYDEVEKKKIYYKLSDYDLVKGIIGHECVNEIVVQRLLRLLNVEHLEYTLVHALVIIDEKEYETYLCQSEDFKEKGEAKITLEDYYAMEKENNESPLDFCKRKGWEKYIYDMLLVDYLVLNRDRHGANIEVLRNKRNKSDRIAPLFDHGLSLLCRCQSNDDLAMFDVMEDKKVQCFVGSNSAVENLKLIPADFYKNIPALKKTDLNIIFKDLDKVIGKEYIKLMRKMIWERWCYIDSIRNSQ